MRPNLKNNCNKKGWGMAHVLELLPSKLKAPKSNSSTAQERCWPKPVQVQRVSDILQSPLLGNLTSDQLCFGHGFLILIFKNVFIYLELVWLGCPDWPQTHDPPVSTTQILYLGGWVQVCTTSFSYYLNFFYYGKFQIDTKVKSIMTPMDKYQPSTVTDS
jgi:hypothetical protein